MAWRPFKHRRDDDGQRSEQSEPLCRTCDGLGLVGPYRCPACSTRVMPYPTLEPVARDFEPDTDRGSESIGLRLVVFAVKRAPRLSRVLVLVLSIWLGVWRTVFPTK